MIRTQNLVLSELQRLDLKGMRVLDIGCRDGLYSFAAERQGANEVIGIDNDLSAGATEFLIPYFRSRVSMLELNLYDLTADRLGTFDVVIFAGVLYHLRFPFWGLKRISDALRLHGTLLLETAIQVDPNREALLFCPVGMDSPYEPSSCSFFNGKGLMDTLASLGISITRIVYLDGAIDDLVGPWRRLREHLRHLVGRGRHSYPIRRAVFTCLRTEPDRDALPAGIGDYWYRTHKLHST